MTSLPLGQPACATVDLSAIRDNVAAVQQRARGAALMAIIKADAYGHGLVPVARAALAAGASHLGIAQVSEALTLRSAGIDAPLFAWIFAPGDDLAPAVQAGIDLSAGSPWSLAAIVDAARRVGVTARVHLKRDTGLGRGGAWGQDWRDLVTAAASAQAEGAIWVVGLFSHLACADEPEHPANATQLAAFREADTDLRRAGLNVEIRHLANSAGTLLDPRTHFDLVRPGIALYGLSPAPHLGDPARFGLREAMRLTARLTSVKTAPAGQGVSYGHRYTTTSDTRLGLVPLGYSDGMPRQASGTGPVQIGGTRHTVAGTLCMDQFVVDLGAESSARPGDEVVIWGRSADGEPTAQDWAQAAGTINYEIVTRLGARVPRTWIGE
ncbi:alanine racemase [Kribbia dieselivorans]|uniref:alanine racemase n=1 Tax=Kribbia dieselivorans TaxID=331526 RepID=UPI00278C42BF|nr:alanine racemase [Kribbia dieselivorans]